MVLLFGDGLQFGLLVVLLGQLGEAHQAGIHLLDGQEAFCSSGERFTVLEEHPHRLRHVPLKKSGHVISAGSNSSRLQMTGVEGNTNHQ